MTYEGLNADQRSGTTLNGKPSLSVAGAAIQLTRSGLSWSPMLGTAATVTYAFRATAPTTMPEDTGGFQQLTSQQIGAVESALKLWSDVANITFVRVGSGTYGSAAYSDNATILFGGYKTGEAGASAFAYQPGNRLASSAAGDVWFNLSYSSNYYPTNQHDYGFLTYVHEIGHAIGLSHPSDYDALDNTSPTYAQAASYAEDSREYSVMSYFNGTETGEALGGYGGYPSGPLIDDIAAAQRLYGANLQTRTGDTVYYATSVYGQTIWDAGGNDTIYADYGSYAQKIDLHAGAFSDVSGGTGNLSIALGTTIENAVGNYGNDVIIGNDADNVLTGGYGNDTLTGNLGNDTLNGGDGIDTAMYNGHLRQYTVTANAAGAKVSGIEGNDTLTSIEYAVFKDGTITYDAGSMAAAVMRLYEAALGRAPDSAGLDNWLHAIEDGMSLQTVAASFLNSPEFGRSSGSLSNAAFVEYLYNHALGRASDAAGKAAWLATLDSGQKTRADVLLGFANSVENTQRTSSILAQGLTETDATYQKMAALYDSAFGRRPDAGGIDYYVSSIKSGSFTFQQIAQAFSISPEFTQRTAGLADDTQYITYLYGTTLHRAPDAGGLATYADALSHHVLTRGEVMIAMSQSFEHMQLLTSHLVNGVDMSFS